MASKTEATLPLILQMFHQYSANIPSMFGGFVAHSATGAASSAIIVLWICSQVILYGIQAIGQQKRAGWAITPHLHNAGTIRHGQGIRPHFQAPGLGIESCAP